MMVTVALIGFAVGAFAGVFVIHGLNVVLDERRWRRRKAALEAMATGETWRLRP